MLYYNCSKGVAINQGALKGSQHHPSEYQIMCVDDFENIVQSGTNPISKGNGKVRARLTFGLLVYRRKRGWVTTLDESKRENEMRRNPKESTKSFVRGKNYEALVVSPPKGFETPSDKIQKNS